MKIDDETVSDDQMKQDVIRVKRYDVDVLGTAVYSLSRSCSGKVLAYGGSDEKCQNLRCEPTEVVNIDYLMLFD